MKTTPLWTRRDRFRFWLQQYDPWMLAGLAFVALILAGSAARHLISTWPQRETIILVTATPPYLLYQRRLRRRSRHWRAAPRGSQPVL
jgi:hypothetical protein